MSVKKIVHQTRKRLSLTTMQKIFFGLLIVIGFATGIFIAQIIITFSDLKDIKQLENYSTYSVPTKVFDANGRLITEFFLEKREIISYKDLPEPLIQAIISIEDNDFYKHHGFNFLAFIRGVIIDPLTGKKARGASTLTQQLAKNLYTSRERSIFRKLIELWYAFQIEKKYSKQEILELYFNQVYLGHGCYGVQSASKFFFDKDAKDMTLAEASLIAGLVQLPERYSPILSPYQAQARHRVVLNSMVKMKFLTKDEADAAFDDFWENYSTYIKVKGITVQRSENNYAPFFTEYIRGQMKDIYGEDRLYSGGLQIYTSLDLDKQKIASEEVRNAVSNEQGNYNQATRSTSTRYKEAYQDIIDLVSLTFGMDNMAIGSSKAKDKLEGIFKNYEDMIYMSSYLFGLDSVNKKMKSRYMLSSMVEKKGDSVEAALISINPKNGYIEAMVGGSAFNYANQLNRTVLARRPMGSGFKPIYYTMAMDKKLITPATVFDDKPMIYKDTAGNLWAPRNYEGTFMGKISVRTALEYSVNVVAIQVWEQLLKTIGYNNIVSLMSDYMGMDVEDAKKRVEPQLSYALGVGIFTPFEVARTYCAIANDGVSVKPISILKVKDRYGRIVDDFEMKRDMDQTSRKQVISTGAAFLMQTILSDVLYYGTGSGAAKNAGFTLTAGGKTGTTPNWKDAWFTGFTKNLVTVVWFGFDDPNKSLGRDRTGAVVAAPVWMQFMKKSLAKTPDVPFTQPDDVVQATVCAESGLIPTQYCPHIRTEYFLRNTTPTRKCDIHTSAGTATEQDEIKNITNEMNFDNLELGIDPPASDDSKNSKPKNSAGKIKNNLDINQDLNLEDNFNINKGIE